MFRSKNTVVASKSKQRIANLKTDCPLYADLFVACQARAGDLENFFEHENHAYPVPLSEYGKLRKCSAKSDFLQCLDDIVKPGLSPPNVEVKIIDAATFFNINKPKTSYRTVLFRRNPMESTTTVRWFKAIGYSIWYLQNGQYQSTNERERDVGLVLG